MYRFLQNGWREPHLTYDSPLNFDLTLNAIRSNYVPCIMSQKKEVAQILSISQMEDHMELLPQEHVCKPESSLIAQVVTAKVGFKVQR